MKEVNIYRPMLDYSANESYKSLRTNLLFCGEEKKVIAITSCTPNEGKSTVSLNLALSLADSGKKVLLINAHFVNLYFWEEQRLIRRSRVFPTFFLIRKPLKT